MQDNPVYPIGQPHQPWTEAEKTHWRAQQHKRRSYHDDVVTRVEALGQGVQVEQYGQLAYEANSYPLLALKIGVWRAEKPTCLVTGGVHGYETSGVLGALYFAEQIAEQYSDSINLLVLPCISPWGYETINRWNPMAIDPNRSFLPSRLAAESNAVMDYIAAMPWPIALHIDLHETTDSDNEEFRPALAARDGVVNKNWNIPDGFYLVACTDRPQPAFQQAIIAAVEKVTHIAEADAENKLIGAPLEQRGVINYAAKKLGLCMGLTDAPLVTTTEVYPDSPRATGENCVLAQVAAVRASLDYLLATAKASG
ncbi:M14 family metallocarboxypeptidase [Simiduia curdlanivorans]|uniref:M14 family metallocarboxypeptidase n=1 Tax=Simiduia curdlanivorans TaxID=1492769 RepID=A0ABV8V736_9GAMM|nr:M14 family metallocarboxypeptidase [Simiduia curdlanivorans]MDN3639045.1 M14 family metallocarboxypeptidase [Simiduia curdlanivorans]